MAFSGFTLCNTFKHVQGVCIVLETLVRRVMPLNQASLSQVGN